MCSSDRGVHQGRVHINDQRTARRGLVVRGVRPGRRPDACPGCGTGSGRSPPAPAHHPRGLDLPDPSPTTLESPSRRVLTQRGARTRPTQWATSASRCRWAIAGGSVSGVSPTVSDMSSSIVMAWLVVVLTVMNTLRESTLPLSWWPVARRCRRRPASWLGGSGARSGRPADMSSALPVGRWRSRPRAWCSPSSCRYRWWRGYEPARRRPGEPSPRWWPRGWTSSCPGAAESVPAGEAAAGRERVLLRPSRAGGAVGGLPHPGSRTACAHRRIRRESESCR
jgi:hypothetical protein